MPQRTQWFETIVHVALVSRVGDGTFAFGQVHDAVVHEKSKETEAVRHAKMFGAPNGIKQQRLQETEKQMVPGVVQGEMHLLCVVDVRHCLCCAWGAGDSNSKCCVRRRLGLGTALFFGNAEDKNACSMCACPPCKDTGTG